MFPTPPDPYPRPASLPPPWVPRAALAGDGNLGGDATIRPAALVAGDEVAETLTTAGTASGDGAAATVGTAGTGASVAAAAEAAAGAALAESEVAPASKSSSGGGELLRVTRWYGKGAGAMPAAIPALLWLQPWPR